MKSFINKFTNRDNSIEILNESKESVMKIEELNKKDINFQLDKKMTNISKISPILHELPNMGMTIKNAQSYIATFSKSGEIMKSTNGGLKAILTKNGKTTEIAKIAKGFNLAALSNLAFSVANMVAAQKHLEDINKKLEVISKDVKEIKNFLSDERLSKIHGNLESIQEIKYYIEHREDSKDDMIYHNSLESIEKETKQIQHHLKLELEQFYDNYKVENKPSVEYIYEQRDILYSKIKEYVLALSIRVISSEIKLILNSRDSIALQRLENMNLEILHIKVTIEKIINDFGKVLLLHKDEELWDENNSSILGATIGGFVGLLGGPLGATFGATIGAGIGAETEKEKLDRENKIKLFKNTLYNDFKPFVSWSERIQHQITTLQNSKNELEIKLLVTTNKSGEITETYVIKEKTVA